LFIAAKPYDKRLPRMAEFLRKGTSSAWACVMLSPITAKLVRRNRSFFIVSFNESLICRIKEALTVEAYTSAIETTELNTLRFIAQAVVH
jgi:hypothetical protein